MQHIVDLAAPPASPIYAMVEMPLMTATALLARLR
jgi:hypothetical protein